MDTIYARYEVERSDFRRGDFISDAVIIEGERYTVVERGTLTPTGRIKIGKDTFTLTELVTVKRGLDRVIRRAADRSQA